MTKEILLAPYGTFEGTDPSTGTGVTEILDDEAIDNMVRNFKDYVLVDKDHNSVKEDRDTTAMGWVKKVWKSAKGLMGQLELTPTGENLVEGKEYKFLSPVWSMYENKPIELKSVAFTNTPAIKQLTINCESMNALKFIANPTCCEKCEDLDEKYVKSADVAEVAHPNALFGETEISIPEGCNILCLLRARSQGKKAKKTRNEDNINNFKEQDIDMNILEKLLKKLGITLEELDAMEVEVKETPAEEVVEEVKEEVKEETENACGETKDEPEAVNEEPKEETKEEPVEEEKKDETPVEEVKSEEPVETEPSEPSEVELLKKQIEDLKAELAANKCKNEEVKEEKKEKEVIPLDALNSAPKSEMVNVKSLRGQALINAIKKNPELVHAFDMEQD